MVASLSVKFSEMSVASVGVPPVADASDAGGSIHQHRCVELTGGGFGNLIKREPQGSSFRVISHMLRPNM